MQIKSYITMQNISNLRKKIFVGVLKQADSITVFKKKFYCKTYSGCTGK